MRKISPALISKFKKREGIGTQPGKKDIADGRKKYGTDPGKGGGAH